MAGRQGAPQNRVTTCAVDVAKDTAELATVLEELREANVVGLWVEASTIKYWRFTSEDKAKLQLAYVFTSCGVVRLELVVGRISS